MRKIIFFSFIVFSPTFSSAFASQSLTIVKNNIPYSVSISGEKSDHLTVSSAGDSYDIDVFKTLPIPYIGEPKVRELLIFENDIELVCGKHDFAKFDPSTKQLQYLGSD